MTEAQGTSLPPGVENHTSARLSPYALGVAFVAADGISRLRREADQDFHFHQFTHFEAKLSTRGTQTSSRNHFPRALDTLDSQSASLDTQTP